MLVYGPKQSGKTTIVKTINQQHKRGIINISDVVDWNIENKTEAGVQVQAFLAEKA